MTAQGLAENLGVGLSLLISVVALWIAMKSDRRMKALSNHHIQEKLAVFASYLPSVQRDRTVPLAERIRNDLAAVSELRAFTSDNQNKKLIRDYVLPILNEYLRTPMEPEVSIAVFEIINTASKFQIYTPEIENLQQRARGLA